MCNNNNSCVWLILIIILVLFSCSWQRIGCSKDGAMRTVEQLAGLMHGVRGRIAVGDE